MAETTSNETVVQLTPRAVEEVKVLQTRPENEGKTLRVYVEQGGCSGMQYSLVFDELRDGDLTAGVEGVPVLIDEFSAKYLRGALVDYSDSLTSGGFKITNPNARESCGCGKSFTT
jgi:iron-sulfur cluster assembly accessory protein